MNPITVPMMVKTSQPIMTYTLLAAVGVAFFGVLYLMFRHRRHMHKAKKHGHGPHPNHRGNH